MTSCHHYKKWNVEKINMKIHIYKNRSVKKEIQSMISVYLNLNKKFRANRVRLSVQFRSFLSNV